MKFARLLLFSLCASALIGAPVRAQVAPFDQWAEKYAEDWVRLDPQSATQSQYFSGAEQDAIDREFTLTSGRKAAEKRAALARRGLEELGRYPAADLSPTQRTSAAVIRWTLEETIAGLEFAGHHFIFEQIGGLQHGVVSFLTSVHPIRNRRDVENYLARLGHVASVLDDGIAEARASAEQGILPPRFILQRTLDQLDNFLTAKPEASVFVTTLRERMAELGTAISPADRDAFVAATEKEVRETILPAFTRVRALLAEQVTQAKDDAGVWRLPRGGDAYAKALEGSTTTALTADQIHEIGLREVARIEGEMDGLLRQLGFKEGKIQQRMDQLNLSLQPPAEPDPRPAIMAQVARVMEDATRRSALIFDLRPKAPVILKREPSFSEKSAAAHYSTPAPDGSTPGIYWIPLADLGPKVIWLGAGLKTTAYHEAIPGHHFQLAIQQESNELPRYRKLGIFGGNSAYVEGWALYAERLADENGWYADDLPGRLGFLQAQLFRARRLVVDTGLHAKHWTVQQVIDYGFTQAETERYVVWPGQACSYMIGQLKILELRDRAKAALGEKFSIKEFHNLLLRGGCLPLSVLEQEVQAWVGEKSKG